MRRLPARNFDGDQGFAYYDNGVQVASIFVQATTDGPAVYTIQVDPAYQRRGLATKLYKAAADLACRKYRAPLVSDIERSAYAQAFWEKQVTKGRATCIRSYKPPGTVADDQTVTGRGGCWRYKLTCPAPRSLARPPRRRR